MRERVPGSFVPLFDRLKSTDERASVITQLSISGVKDSVAQSLSDILGTRSPLPFSRFLKTDEFDSEYGVPDTSALSMHSYADQRTLAAAVKHAVELFEPRLADVSVEVHRASLPGADVQVVISGRLLLRHGAERAIFCMTPTRGALSFAVEVLHE